MTEEQKKALRHVLDLASENVIDDHEAETDEGLAELQQEQLNAIEIVEKLLED